MTIARRAIIALLAFALLGGAAACSQEPEEPVLEPKIAPPLIAEAGVLRAGLDLSYPPFAGEDKGVKAGIDVDLAAAIAERLGLKLEIVDVKPAELAAALSSGTVDIALGATPITEAILADVSTAGSYLTDGPAIFSVVASGTDAPEYSEGSIDGLRVGAQRESAAFWALESEHGEGFTTGYDSLRQAIEALVAGDVDVIVGAASVGTYIARDYEDIRIVGQYGSAYPLGIAVRKDATELETEVRTVLDTLASEGVLDTITRKWLGDFPKLEVREEQ